MTRDKIIAVTIRNFAAFGYQGTSMRNIANEVGIKPASIYHFFANKQELIIEAVRMILDHHFSSMKMTFGNHISITTLFSELLNKVVSHHTQHAEETKAYIMMVNSPMAEIKQEVQAYLENYNQWLVDHLMDAIGSRYPHLLNIEIEEIIDHFIFIGNGLFWGVNIYDEEEIKKDLKQAIHLMNLYLIQVIGSEQLG